MTVLLVLLAVLTAVCVLLAGAGILVYEGVFHRRYRSAAWRSFSLTDFPGLCAETCFFQTYGGHRLAGYHYSRPDWEAKGVVVFAHGYGIGGHCNYLNIIDRLTREGFLVFSYDITGNDQSEGRSVQGLPRGVADLDYALRYVKAEARYDALPILLMGHSWGGHAVGGVLNYHPDVCAVVSLAGFDRSPDMIVQQGRGIVGGLILLLSPFASLYERIKFGSYAAAWASRGFANTNADIMILHSDDDRTVSPANGIDRYQKRFAADPRFTFLRFSKRGHNGLLYTDEAAAYRQSVDRAWRETLSNGQKRASEKDAFYEEHLDRSHCYCFDEALMQRIIAFLSAHCAQD